MATEATSLIYSCLSTVALAALVQGELLGALVVPQQRRLVEMGARMQMVLVVQVAEGGVVEFH